jgi:tetratricopeptide (TPR) repeat protein
LNSIDAQQLNPMLAGEMGYLIDAHERQAHRFSGHIYGGLRWLLPHRLLLDPATRMHLKEHFTALLFDHRHTAALNGVAHALRDRGQFELAHAIYEDVLSIDPRNTEALNGQAKAYGLQGHPQAAMAIYEQILGIDPDNEEVRHAA